MKIRQFEQEDLNESALKVGNGTIDETDKFLYLDSNITTNKGEKRPS